MQTVAAPVTNRLIDRLDEIAAEVAGDITARVPAYAHLPDTVVARALRDALIVYAGAHGKTAALDWFRRLGARSARAGQDVRQLESALRTGARILVREMAGAAARLYPPNDEFVAVMERAFTGEAEIIEAALTAHRIAHAADGRP
ncbi:hypothetical protein [Actinomadura sediminis]|uniref:PucR-like N-terminal domain-containing protein n=1 Tax=Actinomadura sediminis TaxID=1038904 RepID=A0ABW3EK26_9ACTN